MEYHVAKTGSDHNSGSKVAPFLTIGRAASLALPRDKVIIHEGLYRECVVPEHSGRGEGERIVYEAAAGEKVVISGAEEIKNWEHVEGQVYKAEISNELFGSYNPYTTLLFGDWMIYPYPFKLHTGDVYLNGVSLWEVDSLEKVKNPKPLTEGVGPDWEGVKEIVLHPELSTRVWYTEQAEGKTVIYANFGGADPRTELVEINVRQNCFAPQKVQRNFITLRGLEICQAATQWAPPTGVQSGMVDTKWSHHWIIEDCHLHDAKTSAISLGKEYSTGECESTIFRRKPGYQTQMEAVFKALKIGWSKEHNGNHIVRRNDIHDCGQNGVVGHLGCVFSEIVDNHIYNIAKKYEFFGHEIGGIKLHTAIDTIIARNEFHDCALGIWLDWEVQGTRVSSNLFYHNTRDLMIEVTHGPCIVDNNILGSDYNFDNVAQGTALIHNLFMGTTRRVGELKRATPYHLPHSTDVAGVALTYGGDDRVLNNIFVGCPMGPNGISVAGTAHYNGHPESLERYIADAFAGLPEDNSVFEALKDPVYIAHNAYLKGAEHYEIEDGPMVTSLDPKAQIVKDDSGVYLELEADETMLQAVPLINSHDLVPPRITECSYEDPQGRNICFDTALDGARDAAHVIAGPIAVLKPGFNRIKLK